MRATCLTLLLLAGLLSAGEPGWLVETTKKFASDSADERDAASAAIHEHLTRVLAPLLEAMKSTDPEVARRAQETLRSLLPGKPVSQEPEERAAQQGGGGVFVINQAKIGKNLRIVVQNNGRGIRFFNGNPVDPKLQKLGIEGHELEADAVLRKQLRIAAGRGYVIEKVKRGSLAARFGFKPADILIAVNGQRVQKADDVQKALGAMDKRALTAKVVREGVPVNLAWGE